jgi:hypothetical protein
MPVKKHRLSQTKVVLLCWRWTPMNTASQVSGAIRCVFERPAQDVVGLVDDLLRLCPEKGLRLDWQRDHCHIRCLDGCSDETLDQPLRKSVFRAILARLASLCNEGSPTSVSPDGGQGKLSVQTDPPMILRVTFANTTDENWLELVPVSS